MELRPSPERLYCSGILAVLRIEGDPGEGEVVVAGGGAGIAVLAPVSIRRLLLGGESSHHATPQLCPLTVAEDDPRQVHGRHPERVVIGRRPEEGRLVAREVLAPRHGDGKGAHVVLDLRAPPSASLLAEMVGEQTIALEPEVNLAMVDALPRRPLRALTGEEIADPLGEHEPPGITSRRVGRMRRGVEHGGGEDGGREVFQGGGAFQLRDAGTGRSCLEPLLDRGHPGFHQTIVPCGQQGRRSHAPDEQDSEEGKAHARREVAAPAVTGRSRDETGKPDGEPDSYGAISMDVMDGTSIQPSMGPSEGSTFRAAGASRSTESR